MTEREWKIREKKMKEIEVKEMVLQLKIEKNSKEAFPLMEELSHSNKTTH